MLKRIAILMGIAVLAGVVTGAGNEQPRVFTGEIADSQCALNVHSLTRSHQEMLKSKYMGGTAKDCAEYCVKYLGGDFVLSTKDEVYRFDNPEKARPFAGKTVKITGTLEPKMRLIQIEKIDAVKAAK